ncbi:nucleoside/nucleotide kinase family protein [Lactococcus kimchii]|uniref:hypothetical protein n=1 Tax=Lactococcus sp. S-13 TaxID=2507158 RepID=UPI0010234650|nr:hypothetical protein [Lactococcus sp. S-13]RZI49343.1 hypothetical protein EQJ87_07760 [Lactococcus sp. S-13]
MKIININGPINSGKTTISKIIAENLPNSLFVEVDELTTDEENERYFPNFEARIAERLRRLFEKIETALSEQQVDFLIFAYPMYPQLYSKITERICKRASFFVITLCPPLGSLFDEPRESSVRCLGTPAD